MLLPAEMQETLNPAIDAENQLILSQWRNYAVSHSWAEFQYQDDTYVTIRELCEDAVWESGDSASDNIVWIWTVNGEEISRSDELSAEEIDDLILMKTVNGKYREIGGGLYIIMV